MSSTAPNAPISVCFVSRNRCDSLCRAIESALTQQPPAPIILLDDASTDDTAQRVTERFGKRVTVIQSPTNIGCVAARQQLLDTIDTPYAFFLDDDAYFQGPHTLSQTLQDFQADERIAIVAVPYLQQGQLLHAPDPDGRVRIAHLFTNAACAVRKDSVMAVGGYRTSIHIFTEEMDLALRLFKRGLYVRHGSADPPAVHAQHPDRLDPRQQHHRHRHNTTNTFLCAYRYFPLLHLPIVFKGLTAQLYRRRLPAITLPRFACSVARALLTCVAQAFSRQALTTGQYLLWCRCARGEVFLDEQGQLGEPEQQVKQTVEL